MPVDHPGQRPPPRAPRPPRVYLKTVARLTRIAVDEGYGKAKTRRTLHFLLHTARGFSSPAEYVDPENVPDFLGDVAWFEMEKIQRGGDHRWPWWRAIRQVEPPADA